MTRPDMAHQVLVVLPDDRFIYADDLTRWGRGEFLQFLGAVAFLIAFITVVVFGLGFVGTAP